MEALGIDTKLLIAQVVNFAIFFFVFSKFIARPVMKYLNEERAKEKEKEELLLELQARQEKLEQERTQILKKANEESLVLLEEAKKASEAGRADILKAAEHEAEELKKRVHAQIEQEKEGMYREIKEYVVKTSSEITRNVLSEFMDKKEQGNVLDHLTKKIKAN